MTRKKWTTSDQEDWLHARFQDYVGADAENKRSGFYRDVLAGWQEKWPHDEPNAAEIEEAGGVERAVKKKTDWQYKVSSGSAFVIVCHSQLKYSGSDPGLGTTSGQRSQALGCLKPALHGVTSSCTSAECCNHGKHTTRLRMNQNGRPS